MAKHQNSIQRAKEWLCREQAERVKINHMIKYRDNQSGLELLKLRNKQQIQISLSYTSHETGVYKKKLPYMEKQSLCVEVI